MFFISRLQQAKNKNFRCCSNDDAQNFRFVRSSCYIHPSVAVKTLSTISWDFPWASLRNREKEWSAGGNSRNRQKFDRKFVKWPYYSIKSSDGSYFHLGWSEHSLHCYMIFPHTSVPRNAFYLLVFCCLMLLGTPLRLCQNPRFWSVDFQYNFSRFKLLRSLSHGCFSLMSGCGSGGRHLYAMFGRRIQYCAVELNRRREGSGEVIVCDGDTWLAAQT